MIFQTGYFKFLIVYPPEADKFYIFHWLRPMAALRFFLYIPDLYLSEYQ